MTEPIEHDPGEPEDYAGEVVPDPWDERDQQEILSWSSNEPLGWFDARDPDRDHG